MARQRLTVEKKSSIELSLAIELRAKAQLLPALRHRKIFGAGAAFGDLLVVGLKS
jgi:hypothetical protein